MVRDRYGRRFGFWAASILTTASIIALASPGEAPGQTASAEAQAEKQPALEEIVVTARRRSEDLQQAPLAITAFSAAAIEARGMQTVADVTSFTPNVQFDRSAAEAGGGGSTAIAIRGIGQTDYVLTVEPAVGLYLDGVYIGKSMGSLLDLVDIDNIQVLRGPQGTLFGRNTIAGAVVLTSKAPSATPEFSLEATGGSYDRSDFKATVSGPITDRLRLRFSGAYIRHAGFEDRVDERGEDIGQTQGGVRHISARLVADYDVTDDLTARFALDGSQAKDQSPASTLVRASEDQAFASLYNAFVPSGVCLPSAGASRFSNPYCYNTQYVNTPGSLKTTASGADRSDSDIWGANLALNWKLGDVALKSITAYRDVSANTAQELTGSPYYYNEVGQTIRYNEFSEEAQASGSAFGDKLKYVGGFYYLRENGTEVFPVNLTLVQFTSGGKIDNQSFAGFGQITYDIADQLSFTGGLRYSVDEKSFNPAFQTLDGYGYYALKPVPGFVNGIAGAFGAPGTPLFPAGWYSRNSYSMTPSASISYQVMEGVNAYFSYSNGFKGGGFVMRYFPAIIPAAGVNPNSLVGYAAPEKAEQYEVGVKSELFDRRLRLNLAAFRTDYTDIQTTFNVSSPGVGGNFVPVLANAGDALLQGVELESNVVATDWLRLDASAGYLDAHYTSFSELARENYPGVDQLKIPNAPTWTANVGGVADLFDDDRGHASVRLDYSYKTSEYKEFSNDPTLKQGPYGILNATLSYETADGHWSGAFGATNLTNKIYLVSGVSNTGIGYSLAAIADPREFFFRVKYKY
jgi:iron complex outermembrane receptor protein